MKRRLLSLCLALCLAFSLLPASALAAEGHWADSAVSALNGIYGNNVFSASDDTMTLSEAADVLQAMGCESDKLPDPNSGDSSDNATSFTRSVACEVLAEVFKLPVSENSSAIEDFYNQNIINGVAPNDLGENQPISKAQFAVITYRVLNAVGGGMGSSLQSLKPGTDEYFSWMYLAARGVVDFTEEACAGNIDENTWNEWIDTLDPVLKNQDEPDEGDQNGEEPDTAPTEENEPQTRKVFGENPPPCPGEEEKTVTKPQAAVELVNAYMDASKASEENDGFRLIFPDVQPTDWYYDGIMYLYDHGIVAGYADGNFGPNDTLSYATLAIILSRMDDSYSYTPSDDVEDKWAAAQAHALQYIQGKGYIPSSVDGSTTTTREDAIVAIVKQQNVNVSTVNTAILDRFSDGDDVATEKASYIAYAVSIGLVNGTSDGALGLSTGTTRGMFGVILYRTLLGVDATKMQDYAENVSYATNTDTPQVPGEPVALSDTSRTLTLREDWRLISDLDLDLAEGETLTINGDGHYIYEMGGKLLNSGTGTVTFAENTILYPAAGDADASKVTVSGSWDTEESNQLMQIRQPHAVTVGTLTNGTVTATPAAAKAGDTVTLTVTPDEGYQLSALTVTDANGATVTVTNNTFAMPATGVTVTATFTPTTTDPDPDPTPTTYTITFDPNGGTLSNTTATTGADGKLATLPTPTRSGSYTFSGWYTSDGTQVTTDTVFTADTTLTARWTYTGSSNNSSSNNNNTSGTTTETTKNPDGSTTTTVTDNKTGTVTETTKGTDGSSLVVVTEADGTVTTTQTTAEQVVVKTVDQPGEAVTATVTIPAQEKSATVTIPTTTAVTPGTVAKNADTGEIVKLSVPTEDGVLVKLETSANLILVDNSKDFADTDDHWAQDAIDFVTAHGMFNGTSATTFAPESSMTRGMLAVVLHNFEDNPDQTFTGTFDDVTDSDWYADGIRWAASLGIVGGYGNGTFGAQDNITREQLVTILYRYVLAMGYDVTGSANLDNFPDSASLSAYATDAMSWAVATGLITGMEDNTLNPQGTATRAQVATILMRFCTNLTK